MVKWQVLENSKGVFVGSEWKRLLGISADRHYVTLPKGFVLTQYRNLQKLESGETIRSHTRNGDAYEGGFFFKGNVMSYDAERYKRRTNENDPSRRRLERFFLKPNPMRRGNSLREFRI